MQRRTLVTIAGICLSASTACAGGMTRITIVLTGESVGYFEPCGCTAGQLGGIARRHTYLRNLRVARKHVLLLDVGDLSAGFGRQEQLKAETLVNAMNEMGYAAGAVGERDVFLGLAQLTRLQRQVAKFPMLCANLERRKLGGSGERLFPGTTIVSVGRDGPKILLVGLLSKEADELVQALDRSLCVTDPVEALRGAVSRVERVSPLATVNLRRPDLIVVLAHMPQAEALTVARAVPGIDFVLCGGDHVEPRPPQQIDKTWVVTCGAQGKRVVEISLPWSRRTGASRPDITTVTLDERYPDSSDMLALLDGYQALLKREQIMAKGPRSALGNGLEYVGSHACAECHKQHFGRWQSHPHAAAHQTLRRRKRHHDPECVVCHVVGLHYSSGFRSAGSTPHLTGVGCESCHGPGNLHCEQAKRDAQNKGAPAISPRPLRLRGGLESSSGKPYGPTDESTCTNCHDSGHDPQRRYKLFKSEPHCGFEGAKARSQ